MNSSYPVLLTAARTGGEVVPARAQMATTLGFHIILACLGIALPSFVLLAEFIGLRRKNGTVLRLARRWSQAMGVLIAVGAVTGTVLSFEMGLLWPGLMRRYGAVLGLPFGVEGLFFFLEAIFAGIYLWGWQRLRGWAHWWSGVPIAVSGILGAMSVVAVNSWMNQPGGFTEQGGRITSVNPWRVFFNRAALYEMPHMILAAYMVTGFLVAGVYAAGILRGRRDPYHYAGFALGFVPAALLTPFQILVGDTAARAIAHDQPVKFASMEYVPSTSRHSGWVSCCWPPDCGRPGSGGGAAGCRPSGCSGRPARSAAWRQSRPWSAAGWSRRSAGSPGWSTGCRPPLRRPPPTGASSPA